MRKILLTLAATCALLVGGLTWTGTADARPWGYYRAPVARYYGYQPYYYGYRPYYYGYSPYYSYRSYYGGYYGYPYGYSYGYPYYYGTPYVGSRAYFYY